MDKLIRSLYNRACYHYFSNTYLCSRDKTYAWLVDKIFQRLRKKCALHFCIQQFLSQNIMDDPLANRHQCTRGFPLIPIRGDGLPACVPGFPVAPRTDHFYFPSASFFYSGQFVIGWIKRKFI